MSRRLVLFLQLSVSEGQDQGFWKLLGSYHPSLPSEEKERKKLKLIIQSEVSQKEKRQYSVLTHIYGI